MTLFCSPGGQRRHMTPKQFWRWAFFPYGLWVCADGREVLFNRFYEPIWQRSPGGTVLPADPTEWVRSITQQSWFYDDSDCRNETRTRAKAEPALTAWGLLTPDYAEVWHYRERPRDD